LRKTTQSRQGCALPRKFLPSPPPWTGNSSIIFGSNSNVVYRPADALNGRDGRPESGHHRSIEVKRGDRSRLRRATGRPDLAMVPTMRCWSVPTATVGARAFWMTCPLALAATCRGTSAASDPNWRRLPIAMATAPSCCPPGETIAFLDVCTGAGGAVPCPTHKQFADRAHHLVRSLWAQFCQ
jgi:hypothetical protein